MTAERQTFTITVSSPYTAEVSDIVITEPSEADARETRRIVRAQLVVNHKDDSATVKAQLMHQRRRKKDTWEDSPAFSLATLKADQEVRMPLTAGETRRMYDALSTLYQVRVGEWRTGMTKHFTVVETDEALIIGGRQRALIQALLDAEGERFWEYIQDLQPGLLDAVLITREHQRRQAAVDEFEYRLDEGGWSEGEWEFFFRENTWIFGQNLVYQFVSTVADQPTYDDSDVYGEDAQRGDVLLATEAAARFTVLVDLKKPSTPLVLGRKYRNQVFTLSSDLVGGVAQMQSNARNWEIKSATHLRTARKLDQQGIYTYEPRSILIVGNLADLDDDDQRSTFEQFRRNLRVPEIITFDELLARARYGVQIAASS
jgi:hypothetical protein